MENGNFAGASPGTLKSYAAGFGLSLVLTVIPFLLVMVSGFDRSAIIIAVAIFALVQIAVHLVFFLHLNTASEQSWNLIALAYTVVLLGILVGASVWIMVHLNYNMMVR